MSRQLYIYIYSLALDENSSFLARLYTIFSSDSFDVYYIRQRRGRFSRETDRRARRRRVYIIKMRKERFRIYTLCRGVGISAVLAEISLLQATRDSFSRSLEPIDRARSFAYLYIYAFIFQGVIFRSPSHRPVYIRYIYTNF